MNKKLIINAYVICAATKLIWRYWLLSKFLVQHVQKYKNNFSRASSKVQKVMFPSVNL